jgi:hypothetical protein
LTHPLHEGTIGALGRRVLKRDEVAVLKSEVVPKNSGAAVEGSKVKGWATMKFIY